MAAATDAVRQDLALRLSASGFDMGSLVTNVEQLREALALDSHNWVLTGGAAALARPFFHAAIDAEAPVLGLIGEDRAHLQDILRRGATAVLDRFASPEAMRAAVAAICQGLAVWQADEEQAPVLPRPLASLSPRERDVLQRVAAGLSNKVIARQLALSPNTVKFHLQAAFDKLGARSRAEAVAMAMRRGEISV